MSTGSETVILYITKNGLDLARRIGACYPDSMVARFRSGIVPELWGRAKCFIFIMATGIAVRAIAPLLKSKKTDPAVVVLDEKGEFAISLVGGHLGGANARAREIADCLGGKAVITTASDLHGLTSIDLWAGDNDLVIEDWDLVPQMATQLVESRSLKVYTEIAVDLPEEFVKVSDPGSADILITNRNMAAPERGLFLRPRNLVVGIGCNRGASAREIEEAVRKTLEGHDLSFHSIHSIATIDIKKEEPGLVAFAGNCGLRIISFTPEELNSVKGIERSDAAFRATGANAVAEPSALLAAGNEALLVRKKKIGNVTIAVSERKEEVTKKPVEKSGKVTGVPETRRGKIYVVGTGPGGIEHITPYAREAVGKAEAIIGYGTYLDLIEELIRDKEVFSTGMTLEVERCKKAMELAGKGKRVAVISGGDPGIYAMAGLVFELLRNGNGLSVRSETAENKKDSDGRSQSPGPGPLPIDVEVVPGISALNACSSRLGAPLMHDFATISLSDRLTPWELIERRLEAAAKADFVIVLYNPKSKGRVEHIGKAREIVMKERDPGTPVGIVRAAMREGEKVVITDLENMLGHEIDMQTTVIIGNSQTFAWEGRMITPRGYERKFRAKR